MNENVAIFWFRRDLRLDDNVGLYHALKGKLPVVPIFIFDTDILDNLPKNDARVTFIYGTLQHLRTELQKVHGSSIAIYAGRPLEIFEKLVTKYQINTVYTNHDYEPYALKRDDDVRELLKENNIAFKTFKDHVIFEKDDIAKEDGNPYVVYTPFMKKWKERFNASTDVLDYGLYLKNLVQQKRLPNLTLEDIGFVASSIKVSDFNITKDLIENYASTRNYPANQHGTSRLGPHLRFGTISIRKVVKKAIAEKNEIFWNELIWREFFMQILWHFPHTTNKAFKAKYDRIVWRNNETEFERWKNGQTGYALVDAGIRELNQTGYMHNRVRMLVASFLCKHLLIDWRWGEAYFAEKLLDFELASNIGNWQWAAGSGVDAAPYFRIFNPMTQVEKFDNAKTYITKWVPELQELSYPEKIVDHKMARERCLKAYKEALQ